MAKKKGSKSNRPPHWTDDDVAKWEASKPKLLDLLGELNGDVDRFKEIVAVDRFKEIVARRSAGELCAAAFATTEPSESATSVNEFEGPLSPTQWAKRLGKISVTTFWRMSAMADCAQRKSHRK